MLLDRYSATPYHYATPKVGHLPPVKCPHNCPSQTPLPVTCPLVKAHCKLPVQVLAAYPYLAAATEMEITMRYEYAASIGSLVWALTKGASDREGAFDWGR